MHFVNRFIFISFILLSQNPLPSPSGGVGDESFISPIHNQQDGEHTGQSP